MKDHTTSYLRKKRKGLLKRLMDIIPYIVRGSLIEKYKRCGKTGCKCMKGVGHGPKYYLSVSHPGKNPEMEYIAQSQVAQVKESIENLQKSRKIMEDICNINREISRRKKSL